MIFMSMDPKYFYSTEMVYTADNPSYAHDLKADSYDSDRNNSYLKIPAFFIYIFGLFFLFPSLFIKSFSVSTINLLILIAIFIISSKIYDSIFYTIHMHKLKKEYPDRGKENLAKDLINMSEYNSKTKWKKIC